MTPTAEQRAICTAAGTGASLHVNAYAGTGKTSTIVQMADVLSERMPHLKKLAVAFNVRIKDELAERLGGKTDWEVRTLNSLGLGTLGANRAQWNGGQFDIQPHKTRILLDRVFAQPTVGNWLNAERLDPHAVRSALGELVDGAKQFGVRPENVNATALAELATKMAGGDSDSNVENLVGPTATANLQEKFARVLRFALNLNIDLARTAGLMDYNDQVYLAVLYCSHHGRSWDIVCCDESQDFSSLNIAQVTRACRRQLIQCGDRYQNIYQWRGALDNSMDELEREWKERSGAAMERLKLSQSFRCSRVVVARQTRTVGITDYRARADAPLGTIFLPYTVDTSCRWSWARIFKRFARPDAFVLSRTNAPLWLAAAMLASEQRWSPAVFRTHCKMICEPPTHETWQAATNPATLAAGSKATVSERALHTAIAICGWSRTEFFSLFEPQPGPRGIRFSTVHRAKGLEADQVLLFEPANLAETGNLRYVAETRARDGVYGLPLEMHYTAHQPGSPLVRLLTSLDSDWRPADRQDPAVLARTARQIAIGQPIRLLAGVSPAALIPVVGHALQTRPNRFNPSALLANHTAALRRSQ